MEVSTESVEVADQRPEESSEADNILSSRSFSFVKKKQPTVPGQHPCDELYKMEHAKRGLALVFNHRIFENPFLKERNGTENDRDALRDTFSNLKFEVKVYNDLRRLEVLQTLKAISQLDHSDYDCFAVAILTHGKCGGRLFAKDSDYLLSEALKFFKGDMCPSLAGKPKLFFIQACRGEKVDDGVKMKFTAESDIGEEKEIIYTIPAMADILVMYATMEDFYAWRDTKNGSTFIQSLCHILKDCYQQRDLLSMLTLVNRQVAIGFTSNTLDPKLKGKKEMCSIVSMLTRILYFT